VFTNQIAGVASPHYRELTPIALLLVDHTVITVKADAPLKTMRDLTEKLKTDPESISFGVSARGGPNHLAVAQAVRSAGVDPKRLKLVVFKTNADSMTSMMGGHIQAVVSSVSSAVPQVQAGNARMLAVAAPQRGGGVLANVQTMREQGIEARGIANWRVVFGPKGVTPAQAAFWEEAYARIAGTPEWKQQLDAANLDTKFMRGKELAKWLEVEYDATRTTMTDLGLAKN
jgi:putative tricarboxylic transport membrane protein